MDSTHPAHSGDLTAELEAQVRAHSGNLSAIAKARGVSRQAVTRRLQHHKLLDLAAQLAAEARVSGRRRQGGGAAHRQERDRILDALATAATYEDATGPLGMPARTLYRRIRAYKITPQQVAARRRRHARQQPVAPPAPQ